MQTRTTGEYENSIEERQLGGWHKAGGGTVEHDRCISEIEFMDHLATTLTVALDQEILGP